MCRLKIGAASRRKYNNLNRLSTRPAQELYADLENHLHHPWEQICDSIHALQPHNTPKRSKVVLEECAKIPQDAEDSLLGLIARGYLLEGQYRREVHQRKRHQQAFVYPSHRCTIMVGSSMISADLSAGARKTLRLTHRRVHLMLFRTTKKHKTAYRISATSL